MNSIFNDSDLLEALFKIAQQGQAPVNTEQLKNTALKMIDSLKQETSAVKANSNPNFSDLKDLRSFLAWAKSSGATVNGEKVIKDPTADDPTDKGPVAEYLNALLLDLRKKSVGKGLYSESIANLIFQLNKAVGTKLDMYEPEETKTQAPKNPEPANDKAPGTETAKNTMVSIKVGPDGLPVEKSEAGQQGSGAALPAEKIVPGGKMSLTLLNGSVVNVNDIVRRSEQALAYFAKPLPELYVQLHGVVERMGRGMVYFDSVTGKSPNQNSVSTAPTDGELTVKERLSTSFQTASGRQYNNAELATIANAFHSILMEVINFYAILKTVDTFSEWQADFDHQMDMANRYVANFGGASRQLASSHQNNTRI